MLWVKDNRTSWLLFLFSKLAVIARSHCEFFDFTFTPPRGVSSLLLPFEFLRASPHTHKDLVRKTPPRKVVFYVRALRKVFVCVRASSRLTAHYSRLFSYSKNPLRNPHTLSVSIYHVYIESNRSLGSTIGCTLTL